MHFVARCAPSLSLRITALAAGLTLAPLAAHAQGGGSLEGEIDRIFSPFTASGSPGCLVGLDRAGQPPIMKAYGLANLEYNVPLTPQSISESGSVAKQFTAAAVALLHLEGKLSLDDDIRKWIPELPDFGTPLTLRRLLSHTSGIRDQWALLGLMGREPGREVHTNAKILDLAVHQRELNFAPGTEYLYSNMGYVLSAIAVERATGTPFATFTQERLFKPLGMNDTQWRDDYRRIVPNRATAYARSGNGWVQDMPFTMVHGNGGLLSSLPDLLRWNRALDEGLLGKPELTRLLETKTKLVDGREISYALGLTVEEWRPGVREVSHGGSTAGYRTWLARYPEAKASIAVWCNLATANPGALAQRVMEIVIPRPAAKREARTPIDAGTRVRLVGRYRDYATDDVLQVVARGEYLTLEPGTDTLIARGGDRYDDGLGVTVVFEPAGGNAERMRLESRDAMVSVRPFLAAPPVDSTAISRADYVGTYRSPELGSSIVVHLDKGRLMARVTPDDDVVLVPFYTDGFRAMSRPMTLRFERNATGKVTGFRAFAGRARHVRFERVGGL